MVKLRGEVWYARVTKRDGSGKQIQQWIRLPKAKRKGDAAAAAAAIKQEMGAGTYQDRTGVTVGQLLEEWLTGIETRNLETRTLLEYQHKVRKHLIPHLGGIPIEDLTTPRIRTFYALLLKSGRLDKQGGLDPATVERIHCILKQALQQAIEDDVLKTKNPAAAKRLAPKQRQKEIECPDEDQIVALLAAASEAEPRTRTTPLYLPILVLATTGLRRNEALGLRWKDVDLERGMLTVNQTLKQLTLARGGVSAKPSPKNNSSRRTIKLAPVTVEALRGHRETQFARRQELGADYQDQGLIFERGDGTPIRPTTFSNAVAALARRSGLGDFHVHLLRHGHISQLIAQNAPMKAIQVRAGHSKIQTTMNTYGHLLPGVEDEMMERFEANFRHAMDGDG